jgi:hypothetical protein
MSGQCTVRSGKIIIQEAECGQIATQAKSFRCFQFTFCVIDPELPLNPAVLPA